MRRAVLYLVLLVCRLVAVGTAQERDTDWNLSPVNRYDNRRFGPFRDDARDEEEPSEDEIETDRDSFTPATSVVGRRHFVVESAWSYIDNRKVADTNSLPELVCRLGVTDWLELRGGWNYEAGGAPDSISGNTGEDEPDMGGAFERDSQIFYGLKASLTTQRGWRPNSVVIVQAGTPTSGRDTATQMFATYAAGWVLANRWKWDTAVRYGYDSFENMPVNVWSPSTVLKIPLGDRWAVHGEYFGIFRGGGLTTNDQHYFSPGVHYLVTKNLEIGTRLGWGLSHDSAAFFLNTGFGWRY